MLETAPNYLSHSGPWSRRALTKGTWLSADAEQLCATDGTVLSAPRFKALPSKPAYVMGLTWLVLKLAFYHYIGDTTKLSTASYGTFIANMLSQNALLEMLIVDSDNTQRGEVGIRLVLSSGRRVRVVATGSKQANATMERNHSEFKSIVDKCLRVPITRELATTEDGFALLVPLVGQARNNRILAASGAAKIEGLTGVNTSPPSRALTWWNASSAANSMMAREEHREAIRAAVSLSMISPTQQRRLALIDDKLKAAKRGSVLTEGSLVEYKSAGQWVTGHLAARLGPTEKTGLVRPLGALSATTRVDKRLIRPARPTEYDFGSMPHLPSQTVEILEADLTNWDETLQKINSIKTQAPEDGNRLMRIYGQHVMLRCIQCGERRAVTPAAAQNCVSVLCSRLYDRYCGDAGDDELVDSGMWLNATNWISAERPEWCLRPARARGFIGENIPDLPYADDSDIIPKTGEEDSEGEDGGISDIENGEASDFEINATDEEDDDFEGEEGEELALFSTKHCDILDQVLAEVSLMLCLDTFVTASHLALPIRWQVLVFVELASLLLPMVPAILFGSLEPNSLRVANFVFFVALIVMSSFGKRAMEYQERCLFQKYPALISSCAHFSVCSFLTPSRFSL